MPTELAGLPHQRELWENTQDGARIALVGPLGCGKTMSLAVKQALMRSASPGVDGMLVVPTYPLFKMVHLEEWPDIWARMGISANWKGQDGRWFFPQFNNSCWVRTAEKPERLAGPNLADVTYDEPGQMSKVAWERGSVRARHPEASSRQIILGGTPEGLNWFSDLFDTPKPPYITIRAKGWHKDLASYPQQVKETYQHDKSLLKSYLGGMFVPLRVGLCYQFNREEHVRGWGMDNHLPMVLACDFNVDHMRWLVMQSGPDWIYVHDEIAPGHNASTEKCSKWFVSEYADEDTKVVVTGDAAGQARSTSGKIDYQTIIEELEPHFYSVQKRVPKANPRVKERVNAVNYHLAGRGKAVMIHPRCEKLIKDLQRVKWRKGTPEIDKDSDMSLTHASDALGYAIWRLDKPMLATARDAAAVGRAAPGHVSVLNKGF